MFIWDFAVSTVLDQIFNWLNKKIIEWQLSIYNQMGNLGAELFDYPWIKSIVTFFGYLGLALYLVGLVMAVFETAIAYQSGRGNFAETGLNLLKGGLAASLFTIVPVQLFKFSVSLTASLTLSLVHENAYESIGDLASGTLKVVSSGTQVIGFELLFVIILAYAVIKCFLANLKRGGILLTQIAVGSLYMLAIPRGYTDGFVVWCRQIIALCITTMLQTTFLTLGLILFSQNEIIAIGIMLAATEVPRIADRYGLDTSVKGSFASTVYTAQSAMMVVKSISHLV